MIGLLLFTALPIAQSNPVFKWVALVPWVCVGAAGVFFNRRPFGRESIRFILCGAVFAVVWVISFWVRPGGNVMGCLYTVMLALFMFTVGHWMPPDDFFRGPF